MSQKVRKTLIMIVMAALIICLMAASLTYTFTYGRYAGGKFNSTESPYDDLIEFVGAREYTVRSPEELIQAIKDGYSNIVIAEDAEEPFVITEGVTDVEANLVLNLNGKVVVRNSRNPMLDVQTNVSVVLVYDSKQTGAFYNPVGSSLMASGGSLTVGSGGYESGPRAEEYENGTAAGTLSQQPSDVTIYTRGGITSPDNVDRANPNQLSYQKIEASSGLVPKTTGRYYRETADSGYDLVPADTFLVYTIEENCFIGNGKSSGGVTFTKDQLYVNAEKETVEGVATVTASEFTTPLCNVASCDFYYYYPISGTPGSVDQPQDYAVIYGYWDVMKLARDDLPEGQTQGDGMATALKDSGLIYPYGAVRMVEGEGIVRGGTFSNHFDAVNTYGIYAEGGTLSVSKNTTVDTTFTTGGEGVCIRVQSAEAEETTTTGEATTTGGSLTISGGEFSSEIGNTIEMSGGKMTVTKGTFTKNASVEGAASGEGANNGSAIDIQGGTLTMTGSDAKSFTITGSHVNGVRVEGADDTTATATIENATFNFNEGEGSNSVAGVRSFGGTLTVRNSTFNISNGATSGKTITRAAGLSTQGGTVTATTCIFNFAQENATVFPTASAGISSLGGTVTATDSTFTIPGDNNYGIYSSITSGVTGENQYDTTAANCTFKLTGNNNNGIYALGGKTLASGGTYTIGSASGSGENFGIQASSGSVALAGVTLDVYGEKSSCVYAVGGTISLSGENAVNMHFSSGNATISSTAISTEGGAIEVTEGSTSVSSDALGITAREKGGNEGSISIANGAAVTVGSEKSPLPVTGVYVNGGAIENEGTITVFSTIDDRFSWNENEKYNGVYVKGGSLVSAGTLNVTFTGVQNDQNQTDDNEKALTGANAYRLFEIKSYAVRVEGDANTIVTIASGNILNGSYDENGNVKENSGVGGGVLVNGGTVHLGGYVDENGVAHTSPNPVTVQTTGKDVYYTLNGQYINSGIYYAINDQTSANEDNIKNGGNWRYLLPKTGGPAVKVTNGDLSVHGGSYHALQGDGIVINGGTAEIQSGEFLGRDSYYIKNNYRDGNGNWLGASVQTEEISEPQAGPAASYAFKVYNGTANVYGGTFGSSSSIASGAFVMGTSADHQGTAKIYGGSFVVSSGNAGGQAGFSVYEYGNVLVDPGKGGEQQNLGGDVTMTGLAAGLVIEGNTSNTVSVEIKGGEFSSTRDNGNSDGIWYSNSNATLTISDGTFTGHARSGLWFEANPGNNVQLSGGEYRGNGSAWGGNNLGDIQTRNLLVTNNDNGSQTFGWLYDLSGNAIIYAYRLTALGDYDDDRSHVGGEARSVALNGNLSVTETWTSSDPLNNYHFIAVESGSRATDLPLEENRDFGADWASREYPST